MSTPCKNEIKELLLDEKFREDLFRALGPDVAARLFSSDDCEEYFRELASLDEAAEPTDEVVRDTCGLHDMDDLKERLDAFLDTMMPEESLLERVISAVDWFVEDGIGWISNYVSDNTYVQMPSGKHQECTSSGPAADVSKSVEIVFEANCGSEDVHYWTAVLRLEGRYTPDQMVDIEVTDCQDKPIPFARLNILGKILSVKEGHAAITLEDFRKGVTTPEVILTNAFGEETPGSLVILKEHELE